MLALPLGLLLLSSLSASIQAAPISSPSNLGRRALAIPSACEQTCSPLGSAAELGSPCAAGDDACLEAVCQTSGLNAYVDCANCVVQKTDSLSKEDYSAMQAGLVFVLQQCSASGHPSPPDALDDLLPLPTPTSASTASTAPLAATAIASKSTPAVRLPAAATALAASPAKPSDVSIQEAGATSAGVARRPVVGGVVLAALGVVTVLGA